MYFCLHQTNFPAFILNIEIHNVRSLHVGLPSVSLVIYLITPPPALNPTPHGRWPYPFPLCSVISSCRIGLPVGRAAVFSVCSTRALLPEDPLSSDTSRSIPGHVSSSVSSLSPHFTVQDKLIDP